MKASKRTGRSQKKTERELKNPSRATWIGRYIAVMIVGITGTFVLLSTPAVSRNVVNPYCRVVAASCRLILRMLGTKTWGAAGEVHTSDFGIKIGNPCTGLDVTGVLIVAILAFPATWKNKLIGVALGFLAICFLNLSRVLLLFLVGSKWPQMFQSSHMVYGQGYMIVLTVALWFVWASLFSEYAAKNRPVVSR
jgi:exosortase/archaeosortase family protein